MYPIKTPKVIQSLFPNFLWSMSTEEKALYLTFDDGPIPEVTPWVIKTLEQYDAEATFFCVGENIERYPAIFEMLKESGHTLGNHTYNHISGWQSDNIPYYHNVRHCAHLVKSALFRPPYGRLRPRQMQFLQRHYRIVMWDVLSADFDKKTTPEQCLNNVVSRSQPGSIVVFHDSIKSKANLEYALPRVLEHFTALDYKFRKLNSHHIMEKVPSKRA
jgi:peptidoglycan/xylan/chitin deacetylase (PgdA/CDA1 family)